MARLFFCLGALLAGTSVAIGAMAAHSANFDEMQLLWLDKGVRYQMFHSLALLSTGLLLASADEPPKLAVPAGLCFLFGIILFCGSLYVMASSSVDAGLITPAGGMLFLLGWILLALCAPGGR